MRAIRILAFALYGAFLSGANVALADVAQAEALREGTLTKLQFVDPPEAPVRTDFVGFDDTPLDLSDYGGKLVLVNFWATWCAPCKREMPGLDALAGDLGGDGFEVLTIATGRNNPLAMQRFFDDAGLENLPLHRDPGFELAEALGVHGLPYTILLDAQGNILARLRGDAEWDSASARAIIAALID